MSPYFVCSLRFLDFLEQNVLVILDILFHSKATDERLTSKRRFCNILAVVIWLLSTVLIQQMCGLIPHRNCSAAFSYKIHAPFVEIVWRVGSFQNQIINRAELWVKPELVLETALYTFRAETDRVLSGWLSATC